MTTMTSRQRMLAAIRHEPVDRVPVAPWGLGRIAMDSTLGQTLIERTDPWIEVGVGCHPVLGAGVAIEEEREGNRLRRHLHLSGRTLTAEWTTTEQTTACTRYYCQTPEDAEALLREAYLLPEPAVEAFAAHKERIGQNGLVVMGLGNALCFPNDMLGTERCSYLWGTKPTLIKRMVEMAAERIQVVVEMACRGGVDCFRIVGGEYATQLMGPHAWDELVVPYDGPLINLMHRYGAIVHYHNHGNMRGWLERIAALDVDSLDPIEQPPYGNVQMAEAMAAIGERVCLVGGLDDMEVLETEPPEVVRATAEALLQSMDATTGFMLGGTSSGIYGEAAARRFIELVDVAEAFA